MDYRKRISMKFAAAACLLAFLCGCDEVHAQWQSDVWAGATKNEKAAYADCTEMLIRSRASRYARSIRRHCLDYVFKEKIVVQD